MRVVVVVLLDTLDDFQDLLSGLGKILGIEIQYGTKLVDMTVVDVWKRHVITLLFGKMLSPCCKSATKHGVEVGV